MYTSWVNKRATDAIGQPTFIIPPENLMPENIKDRTELNTPPVKDLNNALKFDQNKTDWAILPFAAIEEIIKVLKFGEGKYARGNFATNGGISYSRLVNALIRHTVSFARGEDNDPETGLSHMAHAGCCVVFLLHYITHKDEFTSNDDRSDKILR